jgi:hypothetical protein
MPINVTKYYLSWAYWHTTVVSALRKLRQEDHLFEASMGYIARLSQKNNKKHYL